MYTVNLELAAFLLSLFCIIFCLSVKRRQYTFPKGMKKIAQNRHFLFILLLLSNMLSAAASVVGAYLTEISFEGIGVLQYIFHAMYFFFHSTLSMTFAFYIINVNGASVGRKPVFFTLFTMPYLLSEILVLTNSFTKLVFYMDPETGYHRGPLILLMYAFGAFYVVMGFVYFFKYKKAIPRVDSVAIGVVIVLAAVGIIIQAVFPNLLFELFFEAIAVLVLMMLLEDKNGQIDAITGSLNRIAFADANMRLMETHKRYKIILLKLSNLDLYTRFFNGREIDAVRVKIANWLSSIFPDNDVYSFGYIDFGIISTNLTQMEISEATSKMLERFGREWESDSVSMNLEALIAVISVPDNVSTMADLEDMLSGGYKSKKAGSRIVPYEEIVDFQQRKTIERSLRRAVEEKRLMVYLQPIHSMECGRTVSAEALVRIDDPELGSISPEIYIPIAEKSGLIRDIGDYVFERVCFLLGSDAVKKSKIEYIELNLSIYQFMHEDMIGRFEDIRNKYGIPVTSINLEITESASTNDAPAVIETIKKLRALGYTFSLDDFGTGYSNLVRLISGDYKNVKIDKSLLWNADNNETARLLLNNLIGIIRGLGYNVIQEGVETKEQLDGVMSAGCSMIQGYYFSRPIPEKDFLEYIQREEESAQ